MHTIFQNISELKELCLISMSFLTFYVFTHFRCLTHFLCLFSFFFGGASLVAFLSLRRCSTLFVVCCCVFGVLLDSYLCACYCGGGIGSIIWAGGGCYIASELGTPVIGFRSGSYVYCGKLAGIPCIWWCNGAFINGWSCCSYYCNFRKSRSFFTSSKIYSNCSSRATF